LFLLSGGLAGCGSEQTDQMPALELEPARLTFGEVAPGNEEIQWVTLRNSGDEDLVVFSINVTSGDSDAFMPLHDGGHVAISPGATLEVGILYRSDGAGVRGDLTILSNDPMRRGISVVPMTVETPNGLLAAPDPVDFGRVPRGDIRSHEVTLYNLGVAPIELRDIFVTNNEFEIISGGLDGGLEYLYSDESRGVLIRYESEGGTSIGSLVVRHANGSDSVEIRANSDTPCVEINPPFVDFGGVQTGTFEESVVTISSCSTAPSTAIVEISDLRLGAPPFQAASADFSLEEVTVAPFRIAPGGTAPFILRYAPTGVGADSGVAIIETNDPFFGTIEVPIVGTGLRRMGPIAHAGCRVLGSNGPFSNDVLTSPLTTLECSAAETDGAAIDWEWDVYVSPGGTTTFTPDNSERTTVFIPLSGEYQVGVTVTDDDGLSSTAFVDVVSLSDDDIRIDLTWNTPGDLDQHDEFGADIDLHFLHPSGCWLEPRWDVYYRNPEPNWGDPDSEEDDPRLNLDDTTGAGPENVSLHNPEAVRYGVAVHYYRDHDFGPSLVTLRVYVRGVLVFNAENKELPYSDSWWVVGDLDWPSGVMHPIDANHQGPPPPSCD
jgi:hypothetical protein